VPSAAAINHPAGNTFMEQGVEVTDAALSLYFHVAKNLGAHGSFISFVTGYNGESESFVLGEDGFPRKIALCSHGNKRRQFNTTIKIAQQMMV
jgi:hypothetical protein